MTTGGAVAVLAVAIAALALLFTGQPPTQTPNLVGARPRQLRPRDSVPLAIHHAVCHHHSHHVAISFTDH